MGTLPAGSRLTLRNEYWPQLAFPPPEGDPLVVAVHRLALRAPQNTLTLVAALTGTTVLWVGALDEEMLDPISETGGRSSP